MASILGDWYNLDVKKVAYAVIIPAIGALIGQVLIGWNSDRTHERRWHASLPIIIGAAALVFIPDSNETKWLTITLFTLAMIGMKAYLPAFWALPSLFLTESAAAASIGLINSCGNLGGAFGPSVLGVVKQATGAYRYGLWFLSASVILSAMIIAGLGIGTKAQHEIAESASEPEPEAMIEPA
jgi:ACS family tartrate transporter-like MFS transporter